MSAAHLKRYVGEFDFRHNARKISDIERASLAAEGIQGKRLNIVGLVKPRTPKQQARAFSRWRNRHEPR